MSDYIVSIKEWSDEIAEFYNKSVRTLNENADPDQLNLWRKQFIAFQEDLSKGENLQDLDVYNRANELSTQLRSYLEIDNENIEEDSRSSNNSNVVPIGGHTLPPLPYPYDALEPYIDRETMELHHNKHHKSYVDGLNKAEKEMQKARNSNNFELIKHWEREAAFNGAGHYLHRIFWTIMSPNGGGQPSGRLLREINRSFGSFDQFKKHFSEAANEVEGGGWAILVWSPRARRLEILQAEKHQNLSQWDVVPLLVLDVWEHAYYLKYKNERKKYIDNWWNIVNWAEVEKRFNQASKLKWEPH
ncbi:Fe-Mn family superoxide dismutase [Amphibacillus sp. Q70]|uniref:superoxide dismutase n=1 Tax=Amphibacillus sp. Q70 TaxID=3453416 RepID=UPI003F82EF69